VESAPTKPSPRPSRSPLRALALLALLVGLASFGRDRIRMTWWYLRESLAEWEVAADRVRDPAHLVSEYDEEWLEEALARIRLEQGLEVRVAFVKDVDDGSLEAAALSLLEEVRLEGSARDARAVAFLYDVSTQRLRIEVGYGLEEFLPDVLASYLIHDHAESLFAAGDPIWAIRSGLAFVLHRLREAGLGMPFDARAFAAIPTTTAVGGGAGASGRVSLASSEAPAVRGRLSDAERARFAAQPTPQLAFERYLEWLSAPVLDPNVGLLTPESRRFFASRPLSRALVDYWVYTQHGRAYAAAARRDHALLYFTNDPLAEPHLLRRSDEGWQLDLVTEWRVTRDYAGEPFAWGLVDTGEEWLPLFADRLVTIDGILRVRDGDNRKLSLRWSPP